MATIESKLAVDKLPAGLKRIPLEKQQKEDYAGVVRSINYVISGKTQVEESPKKSAK